jgi:chemotaxis protein methyltransferase CheR
MRQALPSGPFDLILCRNAAFTCLDTVGQHEVAERLVQRLRRGGALLLGKHEALPVGVDGFSRPHTAVPVYLASKPGV